MVHCLQAVKYLFKYVTKGQDRTLYRIEDMDEVSKYKNGRYLSDMEAAWHILGLELDWHILPVMRLPLHLKDEEMVTVPEDGNFQEAMAGPRKPTKQTAYFKFQQENPNYRNIRYVDINEFCTWDDKKNEWKIRKRGHVDEENRVTKICLLYTSPSPRDLSTSRMPSCA